MKKFRCYDLMIIDNKLKELNTTCGVYQLLKTVIGFSFSFYREPIILNLKYTEKLFIEIQRWDFLWTKYESTMYWLLSFVYLNISYTNYYFIIKYQFRYQEERRSNRVGILIHIGIYSVPRLGSEWKAKRVITSLEKSSCLYGQWHIIWYRDKSFFIDQIIDYYKGIWTYGSPKLE